MGLESTAEFRKMGNEMFPNVNLVLNICQLSVYLTVLIKSILKMSNNNF
jgi:hypothetical protein